MRPLRHLLILLALAFAGGMGVAHADVRFKNLTVENGLPSSTVFNIIQDRQGYIWLATSNGLDRYDGYKFVIFKHNPSDPNSLSSDFVKALYEDAQGRIWVGTYGSGLDMYDPATGVFTHHRHDDTRKESLASDKIWSLGPAQDGGILVGTFDSGLDLFDPAKGSARHFRAGDASGLSNDRINSIFTDSRGLIWLATHDGLDEFDLQHGLAHTYFFAPRTKDNNIVWRVAEDARHQLWLATPSGLRAFLPSSSAFEPELLKSTSLGRISSTPLHDVLIDSSGRFWAGSIGSGLYMASPADGGLLNFRQEADNPASLASQLVWSVFEDKSGLIWVATDIGVDVMDPRMLGIAYTTPYKINGAPSSVTNNVEGILTHGDGLLVSTTADIYRIAAAVPGNGPGAVRFAHIDSQRYGDITVMQEDRGGGLLVGTDWKYLLRIDASGRTRDAWSVAGDLDLSRRAMHGILDLGDGSFYLATFGDGLLRFDSNTHKSSRVASPGRDGLQADDIVEIMFRLGSDKLLVGTFRGLFEVDIPSGASKLVPLAAKGTEPVIQALYDDGHGGLWVGTYDGLWKMEIGAGGTLRKTDYHPQLFGTENAAVLSIEPDPQGRLWLAGTNSLLRFDPRNSETLTLGRSQGMPPLEYYSYTHAHTANGWLWFGGPEGLVGFDPGAILPNTHAPDVVINRVTKYVDSKPLSQGLRNGDFLTLNYRDSIVTFDLAAMDYAAPQANVYSYRLVGFQSEWTPPSPAHQVTFTNLSPGRYRLEVKAANNWGTWSARNAAVELQVLPPWWRTWWAYTLYLLFIISSSLTYVYNLKRKIKREKEISASLREANAIKTHFVEELEKQVNKATLDLRETLQGVNLKNAELEIAQKRATEGEQIKSQFLANMSHELRTPLTGVLGYTKLLGSTNLSSEQKDYVGTIRQSSESLLAIINDTLDLSRLEAGKLLIDEVDFDLLEVIESTLELLAPIAYQKRLELVRVVPSDLPLQLRGDPLRLRQILTNLLSNAIKFTESGSVCLKVSELGRDERSVTLSLAVLDTGIGIPRNELDKLFHAYARSRISTQHHVEGTGLGLAICKKLVDLMDGEIKVDSRLGQGSTFEFRLKFKTQKHMEPRISLPERPRILLYDSHPQSNEAWRACLERLGAEVKVIGDLAEAGSVQADAAVMALTERELSQLQELKQKFSPALPPMLILAPRIERQSLKDLSETLFHRVLSKTAREKTVYLELQSLVQRAVRAQPDAAAAPVPTKASPPSEAPLILVADDNRINRRLLVTMLRQAGFRAAEAGNGHELLDLAKREPWHAVLMDIHMPGMDGIEAAGRLHAAMGDKVPPIIAMSADVMPETRRQVLGGLMNDFLVKPFTEQELVDMLHRHLERHARGRLTPAI